MKPKGKGKSNMAKRQDMLERGRAYNDDTLMKGLPEKLRFHSAHPSWHVVSYEAINLCVINPQKLTITASPIPR